MKYTIIVRVTIGLLIMEIQEHLKLGWIPQGGVFMTEDDNYGQALIKPSC